MAALPKQPVFRFAPSPNGLLHLGHAASALRNFDMATASGGRFLLRIEDIDRARCRPDFEAAILEDLAWLGLAWEQPVRRQSQHIADYSAALDVLAAKGITYACFCSRRQVAAAAIPGAHDPDGAPLYPGTCRHLTPDEVHARRRSGQRAAIRLDMHRAHVAGLDWQESGDGTWRTLAAKPQAWGDLLVARKDIGTSYHLAVVVDDALQGVTNVVRGMDLFHATSIHRLLQHHLGLSAPSYCHHALLLDGEGRKLAKSLASHSLRALRAEGATPGDIRAMVQCWA